jgi:hypothetical protein
MTGKAGGLQPYPGNSIATLAGRPLQPNSGIPLDLNWVQEVRVNTSAVERRAQTQVARRTVKKEWQAAWLLRAISCMDLTTLSGDDTEERVRRLCAKARQPVQQDLVRQLGIEELDLKVAAVCVYHLFVETALHALRRVYRRSRSGLRRSAARWRQALTRLTLSSHAPMYLAGAGRRCMTKLQPSNKPAVRLT